MSKKILNKLCVYFGLSLIFVCLVSGQTPKASLPNDQQIKAKVDEYMSATLRNDRFSGSILIARNGQPIVSKGYGMANIELSNPNTPETVYRLGSITKQFTSMAIMILQERGKLNVNDPICKYLSDCPAIWQPITLKNLLTHTSGIQNYTDLTDFTKTAILPTSSAQMMALLKDKPLLFNPGEKYLYCNSGYFFLGTIIEKVSGKTYADFLQENIFNPLGMKATGYDMPQKIIKNRAAGYQSENGEIVNAAYMDMTQPFAAGALYSTTGDLLLWDQALYTEKLISKKSLDETFTPFKGNYGYGWNISKRFDRTIIAHGGGIYGFVTQISRFPDDKVTIIVLCNLQAASPGKVANDLSAIVFGEKYEIPQEHKEIALDSKVIEKYVGSYEVAPGVVISFTVENGKLIGQLGDQPKFGLVPETETRFFAKDKNALITFNKDANGQVIGMTLRQGGGDIPAKKIK
ncbi:MAG: serine hydrolase [Pyrinomonadaceae bacterium]|nr:serine hydrolase [Pyrinomonadaceae bacterium]